jgi:hypothetical protein
MNSMEMSLGVIHSKENQTAILAILAEYHVPVQPDAGATH